MNRLPLRSLECPLLLAGCLLALIAAAVWFAGARASWHGLQVERLLIQDRPVSWDDLGRAMHSADLLERSWAPGRKPHAHALLAVARMGDPALTRAEKLEILRSGEASLFRALAGQPVEANGWARLAYFRHVLAGPSPEVVTALRLSMYTAPTRTNLLFWRLELAADTRPFWDQGFEELVRGQIRHAWQANPRETAKIAVIHGLAPLVREVLADDSEALDRFDRLAARHLPPRVGEP